MIDDALVGTSVTVVLIGEATASRPWVKYEIDKSVQRGNGLLGAHVHQLANAKNERHPKGSVPAKRRFR